MLFTVNKSKQAWSNRYAPGCAASTHQRKSDICNVVDGSRRTRRLPTRKHPPTRQARELCHETRADRGLPDSVVASPCVRWGPVRFQAISKYLEP